MCNLVYIYQQDLLFFSTPIIFGFCQSDYISDYMKTENIIFFSYLTLEFRKAYFYTDLLHV